MLKRRFALPPVLLMSFVFLAVMTACGENPAPDISPPLPPAIPESGLYIGAILLEGQTTIAKFNSDTGANHAIFGEFLTFPDVLTATNDEHRKIKNFINACKAARAIPMLTLESPGGLNSYTTEQVTAFADMLYGFDVSLLLRWNHEMNGSWYAWGQQPTLYISRYREFADVVHKRAPNVAMLWTPNQGWGYPWVGGAHSISAASPDFLLLDTNGDGALTEADDPYGPYYPGDQYVDWVGHSFYHWTSDAVRGKNQIPYDTKWGQANGITNAISNFHDIFAVGHNKPMIVAETAALFDPLDTKGGGDNEADIKKMWIRQVYNLVDTKNPTIPASFPRLRAIVWFNELKYESEVNGNVDWRLNSNPDVVNYYRQIIADPYFIKAP
jgi:hypothetical protein